MLVEISEFKRKIEDHKVIDRERLLNIFHCMTTDAAFFKEIEEGFIPYISLDIKDNKYSLSVTNIKEQGNGLKYIQKKDRLVVKAFPYLREVLAN